METRVRTNDQGDKRKVEQVIRAAARTAAEMKHARSLPNRP